MKVRFSSRKEQNPTHDGGLRVLYAPGKRAAFRLRWYLILLLVAAPFLWFLGKLLMSMLLVEAPARITKPSMEIRALEAGRVNRLAVEPEAVVEAGDILVSLDNPGLRGQLDQLRASLGTQAIAASGAEVRQRDALERRVERARNRIRALEGLVNQGAATRGELDAAENELDAREADLAALDRDLDEPRARRQISALERQQFSVLEQRLAQLTLRAPEGGRVRSIDVVEGENVGPGSLLMRIERRRAPRIHVFLDTQRIDLANEGQPLHLRFPDGTWQKARVTSLPDDIQRLPPDLRSPFGANELGLVVEVSMDDPLPSRWRVNNVPLTARFPSAWQQWWSE